MPSEILHYWTYNDVPLDKLDRETLIEALTLACESNAELQEENARLTKLVIWAPPHVSGHA